MRSVRPHVASNASPTSQRPCCSSSRHNSRNEIAAGANSAGLDPTASYIAIIGI